MIDLDKIRQRWRGVYAVDGVGKVGPSELPPDIAALCDEVGRLREAVRVLLPVAQIYLDAFTDDDTLNMFEAIRLTEVEEIVAALAAPPSPGGDRD